MPSVELVVSAFLLLTFIAAIISIRAKDTVHAGFSSHRSLNHGFRDFTWAAGQSTSRFNAKCYSANPLIL